MTAPSETVDGNHLSARRAATRARLADAAVTVFARKGVPGSTVEEICEEAGFTRGAFYSNFTSKDELCIVVLRRYIDDNIESVRTSLDIPACSGDSLREQIHQIISVFAHGIGSDRDTVLAILEITIEATRNPGLREAYEKVEAAITPALTRMVGQALDDHEVSAVIPVPDLIEVARAVFDARLLAALASGRSADIDRMATQLTTLVLALIDVDGTTD